MAYNSVQEKTVLFGGNDGTYNDETWLYDSSTNSWTQKFPLAKPAIRGMHAMAYDPDNDRVVLFGGYNGMSGYLADTWVYDVVSESWTQKFPGTSPAKRRSHAMVYDSFNNVFILFGGYDSSGNLGDTWIYDPNAGAEGKWTQKMPMVPPSSRSRHAMCFDSNTGLAVLFGGNDGTTDDETWTYNLSSSAQGDWALRNPPSPPPARAGHALAYDSEHRKVLMFGGWDGASPNSYGDTWTYNGKSNRWKNMNTVIAFSDDGL
jgi:N-acetylneuraminic acid mutarotase